MSDLKIADLDKVDIIIYMQHRKKQCKIKIYKNIMFFFQYVTQTILTIINLRL